MDGGVELGVSSLSSLQLTKHIYHRESKADRDTETNLDEFGICIAVGGQITLSPTTKQKDISTAI